MKNQVDLLFVEDEKTFDGYTPTIKKLEQELRAAMLRGNPFLIGEAVQAFRSEVLAELADIQGQNHRLELNVKERRKRMEELEFAERNSTERADHAQQENRSLQRLVDQLREDLALVKGKIKKPVKR